jgi:hypothetical protein
MSNGRARSEGPSGTQTLRSVWVRDPQSWWVAAPSFLAVLQTSCVKNEATQAEDDMSRQLAAPAAKLSAL